jgi:hypothetical protein
VDKVLIIAPTENEMVYWASEIETMAPDVEVHAGVWSRDGKRDLVDIAGSWITLNPITYCVNNTISALAVKFPKKAQRADVRKLVYATFQYKIRLFIIVPKDNGKEETKPVMHELEVTNPKDLVRLLIPDKPKESEKTEGINE